MDKISRYLFIILSLLVFIVVAPLIVLYVSGTRLDFSNRNYQPTGIFTAETIPDSANLALNNHPLEKTPATIRFLTQGEYEARITLPGYFEWVKRLPVEPNKVTYAHEGVNAVHLIRQPEPRTVASGVTSFVLRNDTLWFGTAGKIIRQPLAETQGTAIPAPFTARSLYELSDTPYLVAANEQNKKFLLNTATQTIIPLPIQFDSAADLHVTQDDVLLARVNKTLYAFNMKSKVLTPIAANTLGFALLGNDAYVIRQEPNGLYLQTAIWNGQTFTAYEALLQQPLPAVENAQLIITRQKEVFLLANETLYRANNQLDAISAHVIDAKIDSATKEFTFRTPSELWFYNFVTAKPQLLTRITTPVHAYLIRSALGYGFIGSATGLTALEIDARYHQNEYHLTAGQPVWALATTENAKTSVALVGDTLVIIPLQ